MGSRYVLRRDSRARSEAGAHRSRRRAGAADLYVADDAALALRTSCSQSDGRADNTERRQLARLLARAAGGLGARSSPRCRKPPTSSAYTLTADLVAKMTGGAMSSRACARARRRALFFIGAALWSQSRSRLTRTYKHIYAGAYKMVSPTPSAYLLSTRTRAAYYLAKRIGKGNSAPRSRAHSPRCGSSRCGTPRYARDGRVAAAVTCACVGRVHACASVRRGKGALMRLPMLLLLLLLGLPSCACSNLFSSASSMSPCAGGSNQLYAPIALAFCSSAQNCSSQGSAICKP